MDAQTFENARWLAGDQKVQFRHHACFDMISKGSVLDVGCGDGLLLAMLKEKEITGEGVDFSDEAIRKCASKGIRATKHDLNGRLPFDDNSFDWVVALDVLEHQHDPLSLLKEMTRISKMHVVVGVPNFSSLPARLQVLTGRVPENNKPNKGHIYWFNYSVLVNLGKQAGLKLYTYTANTFRPLSFFGNIFQRFFPNISSLSFIAHFTK
jgi:methionine biosynthesis protein MetW